MDKEKGFFFLIEKKDIQFEQFSLSEQYKPLAEDLRVGLWFSVGWEV